MRHVIGRIIKIAVLSTVSAAIGLPTTVNIGYVSFDVTFAPNVGQVDVINQTGPNASAPGDSTFPVTTSVGLDVTSLLVNFQTGPSETFGPSYFTLDADGLSLDGTPSFNILLDPVTSVVLTGTFSVTSLGLNDGTSLTINPNFSATITDPSGVLSDGDLAVLTASTGTGVTTGPSTVPEPGTWLLFAVGAAMVLLSRKPSSRKAASVLSALAIAGLMAPVLAHADKPSAVKLNSYTTPSAGVAGSTTLSVSGTGFPAAPIAAANATITLAATCGGTPVATASPVNVISIIGSSEKVEFLVPGSLTTGTYYVSVSGTSQAGVPFASNTCSAVQVTKTSTVFGSCNPGSSMGISVPAAVTGTTVPVTAYVPNASWAYAYATGIQAVPLEGTGSAASIPTSDYINSCSTNSVTGVSVCTANNQKIYILSGSSVTTTLTSASNSQAGFSGGYCYNCGVAVNSVTNQAVITMGYSASPSGSALQFLNLSNNTLGTPIPAAHEISEDVLWDPFTNQVLSPNEDHYYDIFTVTGSGTPGPGSVSEAALTISTSGAPDSAGEDCSTHIAITGGEGAGDVFLADLTQAVFAPGSPGSWTAPHSDVNLPEFESLAAGSSAIAVAPGSTHLGVVAGEFGGNYIGVIQLPATSGTGTPALVDYVLAVLPRTPDGNAFANGYDPHTTTAYTSPNNQKAYGVAASWGSTDGPTYIGVIDLQALLAAPRSAAHTVSSSVNLLTSGIVRYVKATP